MNAVRVSEACESSVLCAHCRIPLDARYFDESGVTDAPEPGREVVLARFDLPPQYCGVLEYFSQFTDAFARDCSQIATPGLTWTLRVNQRALYPYLQFDRMLNPWGYGSFQVSLRLDDSATVDFVVRRSAGYALPTSIAAAIIGSAAEQSVTPASMANIRVGTSLIIDSGPKEEEVTVLAVTPTAFSAVFRNDHDTNVKVSATSIRKVGGRIVGRYWYDQGYGDVER